MLLAAGIGSRFGGPKQLEPLGPSGETLMDYAVYDALRSGFQRVVLVTSAGLAADTEQRADSWRDAGADVSLTLQRLDDLPSGFSVPSGRAKPWGTAHAVLAARDLVNSPFAAANADDFYGRAAWAALAVQLFQKPDETALVGYRLGDTLSPHGGVARAVCSVTEAGFLERIREVHDIQAVGGPFTGAETVSMNLWGFPPVAFDALERYFSSFLLAAGSGVEYLIPDAVAAMMADGQRVRVLPAGTGWAGVTYPADGDRVRALLGDLARRGDYPSPLF